MAARDQRRKAEMRGKEHTPLGKTQPHAICHDGANMH